MVVLTSALLALWLTCTATAADLAVHVGGHGKTTVVLVHGNYDDQRTWDRVRADLEREVRVVTLDLPGYGRAPNPDRADSIEAKAEAVAAALDGAGVRRAVFVGNSYGGAIVAALAAAHPERVDGLVLESANFAPNPPRDEAAAAIGRVVAAAARAASLAGDPAADVALRGEVAAALAVVLRAPGAADAALVERLAGNLGPSHLPDLLRAGAAASLDTLPERVAFARTRHAFPVLVLWGLEDVLLPVDGAEQILESLPDAQLVLLGATGHLPHHERPEAFVRVLLDATRHGWPTEDRLVLPSEPYDLPVGPALPRVRALVEVQRTADLRARCAGKEPAACLDLGVRLLRGVGAARDPAAAAGALSTACRASDPSACLELAALGLRGVVPTPDPDRARRLLDDLRATHRSRCGAEPASCVAAARATWLAGGDGLPLARVGCQKHRDPASCALVGEVLVDLRTPVEAWAEGIAPLQAACDGGVGRACWLLGDVTARVGLVELGVHALSEPALERACALGDPQGCGRLGHDRVYGVEHRAGVRLLRLACVLGDAESCRRAADFLGDGKGVVQDVPGAAGLYERACDLGVAEGCTDRAALLGRPASMATRAAELAAQCADQGLLVACAVAADLYLGRLGGPLDPRKAAEVAAAGCRQGDGASCVVEATLSADGRGKHDARADAALDAACGGGHDAGCAELAVLRWAGRGGPVDPASAEALVARIDDPEVLEALGRRFLVGDGVPWDPARGHELLDRACARGRTEACW